MKRVRHLSEATKKTVAANQHFQCANKPGSNIESLDGYKCPLWQLSGGAHGCFDESTYEIDHIDAHSLTQDDSIGNLQALCKMCHGVKTRKFMMQNKHTRESAHHNKCAYEDKINALTKELEEIKETKNNPINTNINLPSPDIITNDIASRGTNIVNNNTIYSKKKNHQCPKCLKIFCRNDVLHNHINKNCKGFSSTKTKCNYCSQNFSNPCNLKRHNKICKLKNENDNTEQIPYNIDELLEELKIIKEENIKLKRENIKLKNQMKET